MLPPAGGGPLHECNIPPVRLGLWRVGEPDRLGLKKLLCRDPVLVVAAMVVTPAQSEDPSFVAMSGQMHGIAEATAVSMRRMRAWPRGNRAGQACGAGDCEVVDIACGASDEARSSRRRNGWPIRLPSGLLMAVLERTAGRRRLMPRVIRADHNGRAVKERRHQRSGRFRLCVMTRFFKVQIAGATTRRR